MGFQDLYDQICDLQMNLKMSRDCTAELRAEVDMLSAERDRYKAALMQLAKHCNDIEYWQVADEALTESVPK